MDNFQKDNRYQNKSGTDKPPNNSITPKEIEAVLKSLSTKNISGQDGFTAEFYQITKEHMIPIFLKIFHKIEREGKLPNSFYEATEQIQEHIKMIITIIKLTSSQGCRVGSNIWKYIKVIHYISRCKEKNLKKPSIKYNSLLY